MFAAKGDFYIVSNPGIKRIGIILDFKPNKLLKYQIFELAISNFLFEWNVINTNTIFGNKSDYF